MLGRRKSQTFGTLHEEPQVDFLPSWIREWFWSQWPLGESINQVSMWGVSHLRLGYPCLKKIEKDQSSRLLAPVKTQNKPACWLTILQVIPLVRTLLINPKRSLGSTGKIRQLTINKTPTVGRETKIVRLIMTYLNNNYTYTVLILIIIRRWWSITYLANLNSPFLGLPYHCHHGAEAVAIWMVFASSDAT